VVIISQNFVFDEMYNSMAELSEMMCNMMRKLRIGGMAGTGYCK